MKFDLLNSLFTTKKYDAHFLPPSLINHSIWKCKVHFFLFLKVKYARILASLKVTIQVKKPMFSSFNRSFQGYGRG